MKTKTKQELEKQLENYLVKASNHVYLIEGGFYYKVLPLHNEGNLYYATLIMGKDKVIMNVKQAIPERDYQCYGNDSANVVKRRLFPEHYKSKSIPNFKRIRNLIDSIKPLIKFDSKSNEELIEIIKGRLIELEPVK
jgi:hypothetical protein